MTRGMAIAGAVAPSAGLTLDAQDTMTTFSRVVLVDGPNRSQPGADAQQTQAELHPWMVSRGALS